MKYHYLIKVIQSKKCISDPVPSECESVCIEALVIKDWITAPYVGDTDSNNQE